MTKRAGIYRLFCTTSGKNYVGQSIDIARRIGWHFRLLQESRHPNQHLQRSFDLHGHDAFLAEVLEYCEQDVLTEREQHWMDHYGFDNLYNTCQAAGSPAGVKRSEDTRRKMSESQKGNQKAKGHINSVESRQMMGKAKKGKKLSKEHREKISKSMKVLRARQRAEKEVAL